MLLILLHIIGQAWISTYRFHHYISCNSFPLHLKKKILLHSRKHIALINSCIQSHTRDLYESHFMDKLINPANGFTVVISCSYIKTFAIFQSIDINITCWLYSELPYTHTHTQKSQDTTFLASANCHHVPAFIILLKRLRGGKKERTLGGKEIGELLVECSN